MTISKLYSTAVVIDLYIFQLLFLLIIIILVNLVYNILLTKFNEAKQSNLSIMRNQYFSGQKPGLETGSIGSKKFETIAHFGDNFFFIDN